MGMKTAVSIPDPVFEAAERLARTQKTSRSRLYAEALREYLSRHAPDEVTARMDQVVEQLGEISPDPLVRRAARETLTRSEW
jgi:metal-responsive CopG/Arc/MetJ family transcriptional regulator